MTDVSSKKCTFVNILYLREKGKWTRGHQPITYFITSGFDNKSYLITRCCYSWSIFHESWHVLVQKTWTDNQGIYLSRSVQRLFGNFIKTLSQKSVSSSKYLHTIQADRLPSIEDFQDNLSRYLNGISHGVKYCEKKSQPGSLTLWRHTSRSQVKNSPNFPLIGASADEGIRLTELEIKTIYISRPPCGKNAVKRRIWLSGPSHG